MLEVNVLLFENQSDEVSKIREVLRSYDTAPAYKISQVITFTDFSQALNSGVFDIVLADYELLYDHLPLSIELVKQIGIPLICLSGVSGEEIAVEMMRLGAVDYLLKPRLERLPQSVQRALDQSNRLTSQVNASEYSLAMITFRLRQAIDLADLLETVVTEVHHWFRAERVIIYPYLHDRFCGVLAETSSSPEWALGDKPFPGIFYEAEWELQYQRGHSRVIEDVYTAPLATEYMCLLLDAQVRSSLVVAIPQGGKIWGFLAVHSCTSPRRWQPSDISLLEQLAPHVAITIHQVSLMERSLSDAHKRRLAEARVVHVTHHDSLTGLPNRVFFMETVAHYIADFSTPFAVVLLDCDRFKSINDRYGYDVGDQVLVSLAQRIRLCLAEGDILCRLGGDKFVILRSGIAPVAEVQQLVEKIQQAVESPLFLAEELIAISMCMGVMVSSSGSLQRAEDALRDTEIALQRAKSQGSGKCVFFEVVMRERLVLRLQLIEDLRRATDREEFFLLYQPIQSLATKRMISLEALLRWQHPRRGTIHPAEFISIAEEAGLIITLGNWVIREVSRQLKGWQQQFPATPALSVCVNVSALQLEENSIVEAIATALAETQIAPGSLKLEITESVFMKDLDRVRTRLEQIRSMGVQILIDDFGTGYSSFSYLQSLPIDALKIDQSFIRQMEQDSNSAQIVEAIVTLAHNMGLGVVAEGVETESQLQQFASMSDDCVQGYLISRPLKVQGVQELLTRQSTSR